jgi:DNA-binding MarR family transcriptional regulator
MLQHALMAGLDGVLERRLKSTRPIVDLAMRATLNLDVASCHLVEQMERITGREGLSRTAYNLLRVLRGQPEGHPRGEIAARLTYRRADVTRIIDGLVRRGLVRRARSRRDRRLSLTRITPKGIEVLSRLDSPIQELIDAYRRKLSAVELAELSRMLEVLYGDEV